MRWDTPPSGYDVNGKRLKVGISASQAKEGKYKNKKTIIDGILFDSKAEATRWQELKFLFDHRQILELQRQVKFDLVVSEKVVCRIVIDFRYKEKDRWVVEDIKGFFTPISKLKYKLFAALYPQIEVRVMRNGVNIFNP